MTVADRIKNKRIELNLSQEELAKKAGYNDKTAISKLEHAGNNITLKQVKRIAPALEVTPEYLMGWESIKTDLPDISVLLNDNVKMLIEDIKPIQEKYNAVFESESFKNLIKIIKECNESQLKMISEIARTIKDQDKEGGSDES